MGRFANDIVLYNNCVSISCVCVYRGMSNQKFLQLKSGFSTSLASVSMHYVDLSLPNFFWQRLRRFLKGKRIVHYPLKFLVSWTLVICVCLSYCGSRIDCSWTVEAVVMQE